MKKRILNLLGMFIISAAIVFTLFQLNTPVVKASGCPPAESMGCSCMLTYSHTLYYEGGSISICRYLCVTCGGAGEPMYIEKEVIVEN
jgi:hypothetical protein